MLAKKTYGADLEHLKVLFLEVGLCVALAISIVAFEWNFKESDTASSWIINSSVEDISDLIPITETPTSTSELPHLAVFSDEIKIVSNDVHLDNVLMVDAEGGKEPIPITSYSPKITDDIVDDTDEPFIVVEEMPTFGNGGLEAFQKYVLSNVVYSETARENNIFGTVLVEFVVGKTGKIDGVKVVRGVDSSLDNEVVRVLRKSPDWKPGYQRGKPVKVKFTLPVKFALE